MQSSKNTFETLPGDIPCLPLWGLHDDLLQVYDFLHVFPHPTFAQPAELVDRDGFFASSTCEGCNAGHLSKIVSFGIDFFSGLGACNVSALNQADRKLVRVE